MRPQIRDRQVLEVHAVDRHRAGPRVVEPQQQRHQRGLAGAGAADDGRHRARTGLEIDTAEHLGVRGIAEVNTPPGDTLDGRGKRYGIDGVGDFRFEVQQPERAFQGDEEVLHPHPGAEQTPRTSRKAANLAPRDLDRSVVPQHEAHEAGHECTRKRLPIVDDEGHHDVLGGDHHAGSKQGHHQGDQDHVEAKEVGRVQSTPGVLVELLEDAPFRAVRLDHLDRPERLLDARREPAVGDAVGQRATADARRRLDDHPGGRNADQYHEQREPGIEGTDDHDAAGHAEEGRRRREDRALDEVHDHRAVLVDPEDGIPDAVVVVIAERKRLRPLDHGDAEVLVDALPDPRAVVPEAGSEQGAEDSSDDAPDHQAVANRAALLARQFGFDGRTRRIIRALLLSDQARGFVIHLAGGYADGCLALALAFGLALGGTQLAELLRVRRDVFVADEQHRGLDGLESFANENLVGEQIHADEVADESGHSTGEHQRDEHDEVEAHGPHVRPGTPRQHDHPPEGHRRRRLDERPVAVSRDQGQRVSVRVPLRRGHVGFAWHSRRCSPTTAPESKAGFVRNAQRMRTAVPGMGRFSRRVTT